jgi:hypothetical protein
LLIAQLTLPQNQYGPAKLTEAAPMALISPAVTCNLLAPVLSISLGQARPTTTGMTVPKAAMYEDDFPTPREHEVRRSRQIFAVETKAIA